MTVKEIWQKVRQTHPDAGEQDVKSKINDALLELIRGKPVLKSYTFNIEEDRRFYAIGDQNSDVKVNKIERVSILNASDVYRKIPRMLNADALINQDRS